jgi:signal transduction histidine kinase
VDLASDVTLDDLVLAHREGYEATEHLKRYTALGMGPDQGRTSSVHGAVLMAGLRGLDAGALGPTEEIDLVGLAAEECARTGAELEVAEGASPVLVQGHARLLRRVLRNLLENARRHGVPVSGGGVPDEAGVRLHISVQAAEGPAPAGAPGRPAMAIVAVDDHGPGVPPELRDRIFEPFYRLPGASEREGGVGLGLSLVKSIALRHSGSIRCEEAPGGGARFVLELPL